MNGSMTVSPTSIAHGEPLPADHARCPSELLWSAVENFPTGRFVHLTVDGSTVTVSYRATWAAACCIADRLARGGIRPSDAIVVHVGRSDLFVPSIWAALLLGTTVIPLYRASSEAQRREQARAVLSHVLHAVPGAHILTDDFDETSSMVSAANTIHFLPPLLEKASSPNPVPPSERSCGRLVVPSSGTTGRPNLVILEPSAIAARWWPNVPAQDDAATFLTWSPLDHIMGLAFASPNLATKVYLPPAAFARRPTSWLDALEAWQVTHATMTNSGMSFLLNALQREPFPDWDLSVVRKIGVGAEAVSPSICSRFVKELSRFGLKDDAIILGYGLTECGPVAGGKRAFEPGAAGANHPVLDRPTRGHSIRVVDPAGTSVRESETGAIEVRGPTMTSGYLGDPEGTASLFTADGWLRTGDRGWMRDGEITITGRDKDIIVVNARKYPSAEIETRVKACTGIEDAFAVQLDPAALEARKARGAPFAVFAAPGTGDGRASLSDIAKSVRKATAERFHFVPTLVVCIATNDIPRTATGKVQRFRLLDLLEQGRWDDDAEWLVQQK